MPDPSSSESPYEFAPRAPASPPVPGEGQAAVPAPEAPAEAEVERLCPHCGFRIVGKPRRNRCPDCAGALDEVAADLLQFSDARWLGTTAAGLWILAAGILLHVPAVIVGWMEGWRLGGIVHAVAGIGCVLGAWLATTAEPRPSAPKLPYASFARWATVVPAVLWALILFAGEPAANTTSGLLLLTLAATGIMALALAWHVRTLAVRVPNDSLAWQFSNLGYIVVAMCVLLIILHALQLADVQHLMFFFCTFPMIAGMVAAVVWIALALAKLGLELRHCAATGEAIVARQALRAQNKR